MGMGTTSHLRGDKFWHTLGSFIKKTLTASKMLTLYSIARTLLTVTLRSLNRVYLSSGLVITISLFFGIFYKENISLYNKSLKNDCDSNFWFKLSNRYDTRHEFIFQGSGQDRMGRDEKNVPWKNSFYPIPSNRVGFTVLPIPSYGMPWYNSYSKKMF